MNKQNSKNRFDYLTASQLAYFAGFIDCSGSISAEIRKGDYVLKYRIVVSISFHQKKKCKHFLGKIQQELKTGVLRDSLSGDMSDLTLFGVELVYPFLQKIKPFIRMKAKQLNLMMRLIEQMKDLNKDIPKFLELCGIVDRIGNLNDSKNRIVTAEVVRETLIPVETESN